MNYLSRRVGSDVASDMVQDVFCRAASSDQTHQLRNPIGFLRRIARNLLIDRIRQDSRREAPLVFDEAIDTPCAPTQEQGIEAADLMRIYEQALDRMPAKTRRIFLLHRVEERSYRDIHEMLGISIATVENHMMKALAGIAAAVNGAR